MHLKFDISEGLTKKFLGCVLGAFVCWEHGGVSQKPSGRGMEQESVLKGLCDQNEFF